MQTQQKIINFAKRKIKGMKNIDWKDQLSSLLSSSPDIQQDTSEEVATEEVPEKKQKQKEPLRIELDKKHRKGKEATIISGFLGSEEELKELARMLKIKCGVGGSARGGEILIQGDFRNKAKEILTDEGYKTKVI